MNDLVEDPDSSAILTIEKTPDRTLYHLKTFGKIAGVTILTAAIYLIFDRDDSILGQYNTCSRWMTVIFGGFAIWYLVRDWLVTRDFTFVFDGDRGTFRVLISNRSPMELSFDSIKRIKVEESSNLFPVYTLSVHLQDGQAIEIDTSSSQEEIMALANRISGLTSKEIVVQGYDDPLTAEEKEEQRRKIWEESYKGD